MKARQANKQKKIPASKTLVSFVCVTFMASDSLKALSLQNFSVLSTVSYLGYFIVLIQDKW